MTRWAMFMAEDLVKWFKANTCVTHGGIRCDDILGEGNKDMGSRCPVIRARHVSEGERAAGGERL